MSKLNYDDTLDLMLQARWLVREATELAQAAARLHELQAVQPNLNRTHGPIAIASMSTMVEEAMTEVRAKVAAVEAALAKITAPQPEAEAA